MVMKGVSLFYTCDIHPSRPLSVNSGFMPNSHALQLNYLSKCQPYNVRLVHTLIALLQPRLVPELPEEWA